MDNFKIIKKEREKNLKKALTTLLFVLLAVFVISGCSSHIKAVTKAVNSQKNDGPGMRTITDSLGRVVEIPEKVEKIIPLGNTPRMIAYLGLAEKAVGISGFDEKTLSPVQAYAYANKDIWGKLPVVGTDSAGATDFYPEEIIKTEPDVILCSYPKELTDNIQTKTGKPVVSVPMGTLFKEDYEEALRILGDVCNSKEKAEEVISFINICLEDLNKRTKDIPDSGKPSVLGAAATFKGSHSIEGVYSRYPVFETINAFDIAKDISETSSALVVDKEQILEWNPEYIFFDFTGVPLVQEDYKKSSEFFEKLAAVKNNNLYQYPNSTYYFSNLEIPILNSYYVASIIFPEQFNDINFRDKAAEIFEFFLGDRDYLAKLEEIGAGYNKVTLGE